MKINKNYQKLEDSYLFSTIAHKVAEFTQKNPDASVIRLGIGDVTLPLAPAVVKAMNKAVEEMGVKESFRGYGPEQGYGFLKEAIQKYYASRNTHLELDEIFISDGAKSDVGNILDLFSQDNTVLVPNPVYPVYVDTNVMAGRKIVFADANEANDFLPMPDENIKADIIYICSPNNPTGAVYTKEGLKKWVDYALSKIIGESMQTPPVYSAVHINGKRAYAEARKNRDVVMPERKIIVYEAKKLSYDDGLLVARFHVSKGTYIRALARDIAYSVGKVAHLTALVAAFLLTIILGNFKKDNKAATV